MINFLLPTKAATKETLGHPSSGIIGFNDGAENASGVAVTKDSALTYAAVWAATRVISETLATLPCILYKRSPDGSRERMTSDPRFRLVHDQPHPMMSAMSYFESQTAQLVLTGNTYSRIRFDGQMQPRQLEPRLPETVELKIEGDQVTYSVEGNGTSESLPASEMLHVPGLGGDGLSGWSVITMAQQSIGTGMAGENYAAGIMGTGATPHGVIDHPGRLDKPAREQFRREWNESHKGSGKAGNIAILHGGIKYQPVSMSNQDAQFLESREYSVREVARWFRLPPHMLADLADSSVRANIEQQAIEFVVYSLMPWLTRWQQELNRKLLTETEREPMFFEFLTNALLKGDAKSRFESYATGRQWGWLSINDIRKLENLDPVDGGDDYLQPTNMEVVGEESEEPVVMSSNIPPQGSPFPQQNDDEEVAEDLRENLTESLAEVLNAGKQLREDLETGQTELRQAMAEADERNTRELSSLRSDRSDMHDEFTRERRAQVQGAGMLADACDDLLQNHLACLVRLERSKVSAAARKVDRGENFVEWADAFYGGHIQVVTDKVEGAFTCYRNVQPETPWDAAAVLAARICSEHKRDVLEAADGDPGGFLDRIQATLSRWANEATTITCEGADQ